MGADSISFQNCDINVLCGCTDLRMVDEGEIIINPGPNNGVNAPDVSTMYLDGNPVAPGPYYAEEDVSFADEALNISGPFPDGLGYYLDISPANQQGAAGKKTTSRLNLVQWEKLSKKELDCAEGRLAKAAKVYKDKPQQLELVKGWAAIVDKLKAEK